MNALGIDLSTHAVDLVLLDENADRAEWVRLDLGTNTSAFERVRQVPDVMPQPGWYESHGVYLCAIEEPKGFRSHLLYRVQGAVLASLPAGILCWPVMPHEWKAELGLKPSEKPTAWTFSPLQWELHGGDWSQDALDALGIAYYARETNARDVAKALGRIA